MLCYEYPPIGGGGAKVVNGLTRELCRMGYEIDLVTMGYKNLPSFEKKDNLNIYRVKCLRLSAGVCTYPEMFLYVLLAFPLILKLIKRNKYNFNHTHFIFPDGILAYIAKKMIGLNYVITAHGSDVPGYNPDRFKILHKILKPVWKKIALNSEKIILPSKNLEQMIKNINAELRTTVIPNGIRLDKFSYNVTKKKQILVVTRMFERKGVQYFLKALAELNHNYIVNMVGDGPYLPTLRNISEDLNLNINFLGFVDNHSDQLKNLFEESEIFVFTSEAENFPVVLLEAMISGMAIITTNDTGCAEVVGDAAILVNSKDSDAIGEALTTLFNKPELNSALRAASRKRVQELFGWRTIALKYSEVYPKGEYEKELSSLNGKSFVK